MDLQQLEELVFQLIGSGVESESRLTVMNMVIRAVIVYILAVMMVRIGEKRFFGKNTAFDIILGIMFGSVVSRAITGSTEFLPTLSAGFVLILMHWLFAALAFYVDGVGVFLKGRNRLLVQDGEMLWEAMRDSHITERDLMSALRSQARIDSIEDVKEARLERSGSISVIRKESDD